MILRLPSKYLIVLAMLNFVLFNPGLVLAQNSNLPITTNNNSAAAGASNLPQYNRGVDTSIQAFLCAPSGDGNDLARCINRVYRFGVAFGAIALVFFLVWAGYMYMLGGETQKAKAKGMIQNSFLGMGLLLGSYVLLRFINPNLVTFKPIQPPIFTAELPSCAQVGLGEDCILAGGQVGVGNGSGGGTAITPCKQPLVKVKSAGINVYFGKDPVICPGLLNKIKEFDSLMKASRLVWGVTATVEGGHRDRCHTAGTDESGTCFDMDVPTASSNAAQWEQTCKHLRAVGLTLIVNETHTDEAPSCGKKDRYPTSRGDSLHINYAEG